MNFRRNVRESSMRAVHVVSWTERPVALYLHLRRSEFSEPPNMLVTPASPVPIPIEPSVVGGYYIYQLGGPIWAILY